MSQAVGLFGSQTPAGYAGVILQATSTGCNPGSATAAAACSSSSAGTAAAAAGVPSTSVSRG